jgi:hypothetical protein
MSRAEGTFEIKSWDESTYEEIDGGGKLNRAHVVQAFTGGFEGEGTVEHLMHYRDDGTATFVGLERFTGNLGGRAGSFVIQGEGTFDGSVAQGPWTVIAGSGTGELAGLRGTGQFWAKGHDTSYSLDYDFE